MKKTLLLLATISVNINMFATCPTPVITQQLRDVTTCAGQFASFSIAATGNDLTDQWQVDHVAGFTDIFRVPYVIATGGGLSIPFVPITFSGYQYRCVVTDSCGQAITSNAATLIVNPLPIVTVNSVTICAGQTAALTASGATHYTWLIIDTTTIPLPPTPPTDPSQAPPPAPGTGTGT